MKLTISIWQWVLFYLTLLPTTNATFKIKIQQKPRQHYTRDNAILVANQKNLQKNEQEREWGKKKRWQPLPLTTPTWWLWFGGGGGGNVGVWLLMVAAIAAATFGGKCIMFIAFCFITLLFHCQGFKVI